MRRLGRGEKRGGGGGDNHVYRAVAVLVEMVYRLLVRFSKAVRRRGLSGLERAVGGPRQKCS